MIEALLREVQERGIHLWVEDGALCFDAPKGSLTPRLKVRLKRLKPQLVAHLSKVKASPQIPVRDEASPEEIGDPVPIPRPPAPPELLATLPRQRALAEQGHQFTIMPQSFSQQRLWFLDQLEGQTNYVINDSLILHGAFDMTAVNRTLDDLYRRHEVLRSTFHMWQGQPIQLIGSERNMQPNVIDMRGLTREMRQKHAYDLIRDELYQPFDLEGGPLFRVSLMLFSNRQRALLLTMHHVIGDGWSVGVLTRELVALYLSHIQGRPSGLPPIRLQYADYCHWQQKKLQGESLEQMRDFWVSQLKGAPDLIQLPTDKPRMALNRHVGENIDFPVPEKTALALRELTKQGRATPFMATLAVFKLLLAKYSGQRDISVGFPIANRENDLLENLVGLFINTIVLRTVFHHNPNFLDLLKKVRETSLGAFAHQAMPFERLVEELKPARNLSYAPLFQVLMSYQNTPPSNVEEVVDRMTTQELGATWLARPEINARFDLELTIFEVPEGFACQLHFDSDLFLRSTVERMARHFINLMEAVVATPEMPIEGLSLLSQSERQQILEEAHRSDHPFLERPLVHERVRALATSNPQGIALIDAQGAIDFATLEQVSSRFAALLAQRGVRPGHLVPLMMERGRDFLTAMQAVFRLGAAYLPLNPSHPPRRLSAVLAQAEAPVILSHPQFVNPLQEALQCLEGVSTNIATTAEAEHINSAPPEPDVDPHQWAYAIFTSGSTGTPKGAIVTHRGMNNHLQAKIKDLTLDANDIVVQNANQCFDISVWQFLIAPILGGTTLVADDETAREPLQLLKLVQDAHATVLEVVPSLLEVFISELEHERQELPSLRWLIPTGEALGPDLARRWLALFPQIPLVNAYGPTECSDDVTHHLIDTPPEPWVSSMPIGVPVINTQLYVVDAQLELLPAGVPGELLVGGNGVGGGYLCMPARTAVSFIPNPFTQHSAHNRLYRTGDRAIARDDGILVYLGRLDHQVKVRGFRIELGEIERALTNCEQVTQAAALVRRDAGANHLQAFVVTKDGEEVSEAALKNQLTHHLPDYMVPTRIYSVARLPLTPNGKLDRTTLATMAPEILQETQEALVEPRDHMELQLVHIWERLLETHPISIRANFFELGGHSILAIRLMSEIAQTLDIRLPLASLFQSPTIEGLAQLLRQKTQKTGGPLITLRETGDAPPLYLCHPAGGNVLCYRDLAYRLNDRPVFAIEAAGVQGEDEPFEEIHAIAQHCAQAILDHNSEGPYHLAGWSFGGLAAFETARIFQQQGKSIATVVLLDSPAPPEEGDAQDLLPRILLNELQVYYGQLPITVDHLRQRDAQQQLDLVVDLARKAGMLDEVFDEATVRRLLWVYRSSFQAVTTYRPEPEDLNMHLIQAAQAHQTPRDRWHSLSSGRLQVHQVSGSHHGMLKEPHAAELAQSLKQILPSNPKEAP